MQRVRRQAFMVGIAAVSGAPANANNVGVPFKAWTGGHAGARTATTNTPVLMSTAGRLRSSTLSSSRTVGGMGR